MRALFLPYGPIHSITIPTAKTEDGKKPRARGFAFVWFFSKKDAERAIEGANGRSVAAGAVTAPTMNKKERARLRKKLREQQKLEGGGVEKVEGDEEGEEEEDEEKEKEESDQKFEPRIIAVDWALSKEKWEEMTLKGLIPVGEAKDSSVDEGTERGDSDSEGEDDDEEAAWEDEDMSIDERSDNEQAAKPSLPQTDVGTTLFIRNVPFDATEDDLRTLYVFVPVANQNFVLNILDSEPSAPCDMLALPWITKLEGLEEQVLFASGIKKMRTRLFTRANCSTEK